MRCTGLHPGPAAVLSGSCNLLLDARPRAGPGAGVDLLSVTGRSPAAPRAARRAPPISGRVHRFFTTAYLSVYFYADRMTVKATADLGAIVVDGYDATGHLRAHHTRAGPAMVHVAVKVRPDRLRRRRRRRCGTQPDGSAFAFVW